MRGGVLTSNDSGGAVQLVAAHCLNERTLDPAVCSYNRPTYALASRTMAFTMAYDIYFSQVVLPAIRVCSNIHCSVN